MPYLPVPRHSPSTVVPSPHAMEQRPSPLNQAQVQVLSEAQKPVYSTPLPRGFLERQLRFFGGSGAGLVSVGWWGQGPARQL
jgi:hypothetical protein